jgi:hypothetical protein
MNSKTQAQKGFKTFILTLAISLAVFSGIYYIINSEDENAQVVTTPESNTANVLDAKVEGSVAEESDTLGEQSDRSKEEDSVFADLAGTKNVALGEEEESAADTDADAKPVVKAASSKKPGNVLAGADVGETTESTVPDTGIAGPTTGIILTLVILSLVIYIYFVGPRKLALSSFEKDLLDDLD